MDNIATVTINRLHEDITVGFKLVGGEWFFTDILTEDGETTTLTETEELLARSLVKAGVDETGR